MSVAVPLTPKWFRRRGKVIHFAIEPPDPAPGRDGLAVMAIMKDEEASIRDWIMYHALAGVDQFILYDNGSSDRTVELAQAVSNTSVIVFPWDLHVTSYRRKQVMHPQTLAYCHAIKTFGSRFRWMAFIDIDEFIVPREHDSIPEALETLRDHQNISLPWVMFGHSGHENPPEESVLFSYVARARGMNHRDHNFKCIVDPCTVTCAGTHRFMTKNIGERTANALGHTVDRWEDRKREGFLTTEVIQFNHYFLKSRSELKQKMHRRPLFGVSQRRHTSRIRALAKSIESDTVEDTAILDFLGRHNVHTREDLETYVRVYC